MPSVLFLDTGKVSPATRREATTEAYVQYAARGSDGNAAALRIITHSAGINDALMVDQERSIIGQASAPTEERENPLAAERTRTFPKALIQGRAFPQVF